VQNGAGRSVPTAVNGTPGGAALDDTVIGRQRTVERLEGDIHRSNGWRADRLLLGGPDQLDPVARLETSTELQTLFEMFIRRVDKPGVAQRRTDHGHTP